MQTYTPAPAPVAPPASTPSKLSSDQFAQQIKAKYPAYANVDNATLTQKMLAKYPQYAGRVDLTPSAQATPTGPGFFGGVASDLTQRGQNVVNDVHQAGSELADAPPSLPAKALYAGLLTARTAGRAAGQVAAGVGDIIGRGISKILPKSVTDTAAGAVQKVAQTPVGQKVIQAGKTAYAAIPAPIRPDVASVANTVGLAVGGKGANAAEGAAGSVAKQVLPRLTSAAEKVAGAVSDARQGAAPAASTLKAALKAVTPDINAASKTAKGKLIGQTVDGAPRVNEGGIFKSRTITPNASEQAAARELASLPQYRPSATALQNFNTVKNVITGKAQTFEKSLEAEKTNVPKKEIVSTVDHAISDTAEQSLLLQGSDPAAAQYLRVVANATSKATGTPSGIWQVRKAMDAAYENARGKLAYDSEKVAALDDIHRAGRNALNDMLAKYAKNTNVKTQFQSLKNLYNAKDELLVKAQSEKGSVLKRANAAIHRNPAGALVGGYVADKAVKAVTGFGI